MIDYQDVLRIIGLNFRVERVKQKLSQERFAEIAGVHTNYIGKIERGEQNITIKTLIELVNSLNISVVDVLKNFSSLM